MGIFGIFGYPTKFGAKKNPENEKTQPEKSPEKPPAWLEVEKCNFQRVWVMFWERIIGEWRWF